MPTYPIEPAKLLDAAERLVPVNPGRGRPPHTAHRRAVSTAYYALFHAIGARVALTVFPAADPVFPQRVQRWINHADIKAVAGWIVQLQTGAGSAPDHIRRLFVSAAAATPVDAGVVAIADAFLVLLERREEADYDHEAIFTRPDTLGLMSLARQRVGLVERADGQQALAFFGLIGMQSKIQKR